VREKLEQRVDVGGTVASARAGPKARGQRARILETLPSDIGGIERRIEQRTALLGDDRNPFPWRCEIVGDPARGDKAGLRTQDARLPSSVQAIFPPGFSPSCAALSAIWAFPAPWSGLPDGPRALTDRTGSFEHLPPTLGKGIQPVDELDAFDA
jgi:hypothetical protein